MDRLILKLLIAGMFIMSGLGSAAYATGEPEIEQQSYKTFDFHLDSDEAGTDISTIAFIGHYNLSVMVNDIAKGGSYLVNDDHILLTYRDPDNVAVTLHLSYDSLGADINGTIEDVTIEFLSPLTAELKEEYLTYHEDFLDKNYTLRLIQEHQNNEDSVFVVQDPRIAELKNDMFVLRHMGIDEYVYFSDFNEIWVEERDYQPSGFYPEGRYMIQDDYLTLQMDLFDEGSVQFYMTFDDLTEDVIAGVIEDVEWVSEGDAPQEFEKEREQVVGTEYELIRQERVDQLIDNNFDLDINDGAATVQVSLEENHVAEVEYSGEVFEGTFELDLDNIVIQIEEVSGVTTHIYVPFRFLSVEDGTGTVAYMTHTFSGDAIGDALLGFESVFDTESR